jgi:hypothetical protein
MADDPNAKPPLLPEFIEGANWPHFLRHPVDPGERARRALQAADELRERMANRELRTETLHRAIARFVRAMKKSGWPRKVIIPDAARTYGVSERTVETAIKKFQKEFYFTDDLPIELRLLALGLPLPR